MPNYASNRLILTGPADEIARFVRECIRVRPDDEPNDEPSLDLDALVPMPPEIRATYDGATDELRAIALAATGHEGWYDWCYANWGTKWNTSDFRGRLIGDEVYDCDFATAWICPVPALRALAEAYPLLRGAVAASEPDNDWFLIAVLKDGDLVEAEGRYDQQMQMLVRGGLLPEPFASLSLEALLTMTGDRLTAATADDVWAQAFQAIEHFGYRVGGDLPLRLAFERIVHKVCDLLDVGHKEDVLNSDLAHALGIKGHVDFLLTHDRTRTPIDRQLLKTLAGCLRADAMWGGGDSESYTDDIEMEIFDCFGEDDLHDWACLAMFRPGAMLDYRSDEALRESFVAYATLLRNDILVHLSASISGCDHLHAAA